MIFLILGILQIKYFISFQFCGKNTNKYAFQGGQQTIGQSLVDLHCRRCVQ
jgi:hypothetical protein